MRYNVENAKMIEAIMIPASQIVQQRGIGEIGRKPGFYRWYFKKEFLSILNKIGLPPIPEEKKREKGGLYCYYIGVAETLNQRFLWHLEQRNTTCVLSNDFLSTFRRTLLAVLGIKYVNSDEALNAFLREWNVEWKVCETKSAAEAIEDAELKKRLQFIYPLNLRKNTHLRSINGGSEFLGRLTKLRNEEKIYSGHNLIRQNLNIADWLNPAVQQLLIAQLPLL